MKMPLTLEIKGNALDDGPGIRTVVFFKGCPLDCLWCHNPESKQADVQIGYDAKACIGCDTCMTVCPDNAIDRRHVLFVDRTKCSLCFDCVDNCPSGALSRVGTQLEIHEIVNIILKDKPFFDTSHGGVTLSGGEPTLFMDYAGQLLENLKKNGIHTLIETCGQFEFKRFEQTLYPFVDMIYFDLKLIDPKAHKRYCGISNHTILTNFEKLNQMANSGKTPILPRTPLIPGITDTLENMESIAGFLHANGARKTQLLPYHPLWQEKNAKIGIHSDPHDQKALSQWPDRNIIEKLRPIFSRYGIVV